MRLGCRSRKVLGYRSRKTTTRDPYPVGVRPQIGGNWVVPDKVLMTSGNFDINAVPTSISAQYDAETVIARSLIQASLLLGESLSYDPFQSAAKIASRIDAVVNDNDQYELDEPKPTAEAVATAKDLIRFAERDGSHIPVPKISVYFGEIDLTWTVQNRLLRLIVFSNPDRPALLYSQTDEGEALTRGQSMPLKDPLDLTGMIRWLLAR